VSVLLPAALFAAAGTLVAGALDALVFIPLIIILAASLAASAIPGRVERFAVTVLAVGCGFIIGAGAARSSEIASITRLPVAEAEIVTARGIVEHAVDRGGELLVRVRLAEVAGTWVRGEAAGPARIVASDGRLPVRGETVIVGVSPGGVWRDDESTLWMRAETLELIPGRGGGLAYATETVRASLRRASARVAGSAAPLVTALLLGETDELDPRVETLFRRSGAIHLLALSGMHLAVIALFIRGLVRPVAGPRVAALASLIAALCYIAVVGPRPGLVRATLLVAVAALMGTIDRKRPLIELLAACYLLHLIIQPGAAGSLGFRLSYLSLAGISLLARPIVRRLRGWVPPTIASPLAAGVGAQLLTTPLLFSQFSVWYPIGLIASLVLGPVVLLMMSVGLVAVIGDLAGFRVISLLSAPVLESLYRGAEWMSWALSGVPGVMPTSVRSSVIVASVALAGACAWGIFELYGRHDGIRRA